MADGTSEEGAGNMGRAQMNFPARGDSQRQGQRCHYNLRWETALCVQEGADGTCGKAIYGLNVSRWAGMENRVSTAVS